MGLIFLVARDLIHHEFGGNKKICEILPRTFRQTFSIRFNPRTLLCDSSAVSEAVSEAVSVALALACPAVGKSSRASSAGGRRHLQ